jgi:hypothetical protein
MLVWSAKIVDRITLLAVHGDDYSVVVLARELVHCHEREHGR